LIKLCFKQRKNWCYWRRNWWRLKKENCSLLSPISKL